jgi:hypothetical protein
MNETYYYVIEGMVSDEPKGPVTLEQIATLLLKGKITPKTLALKTGDADWQRVQDYSSISAAVQQLKAERTQQLQQQAAELEQQRQVAAAEKAERQVVQQQQQQAVFEQQQTQQQAQVQQQQVQSVMRQQQFQSGLKQEGDYQKRFKLVWVAEGSGKKPLYNKVQQILSQHGEAGWTFEHMHETVWVANKHRMIKNPCCVCLAKVRVDYEVTENVMVLVFSVPAAIADQFPDIV